MRIAQEKKEWIKEHVMENMNACVMDVGQHDFMPRSQDQLGMPANASVMRDDRLSCMSGMSFMVICIRCCDPSQDNMFRIMLKNPAFAKAAAGVWLLVHMTSFFASACHDQLTSLSLIHI